ncbi:MAG TPA: YchJ family metal-binding protein [Treponemataceae bacterium]|nr:YchJ family metal-binding protein [Treponemataceae bacterium]
MKNKLCPCGSKKNYKECCEPIITNKIMAPTAQALMRARYSSYVKHEIDFIMSSCANTASADNDIDETETRKWAEESTWQGLEILRTEKGTENDDEGIVEFTATYTTKKGMREVHKERSFFSKKTGTWLYESGELIPTTVVRARKKVGRNDLCPCGSEKKYKKCCGS